MSEGPLYELGKHAPPVAAAQVQQRLALARLGEREHPHHPGVNPGANKYFLQSTPIQMLPRQHERGDERERGHGVVSTVSALTPRGFTRCSF